MVRENTPDEVLQDTLCDNPYHACCFMPQTLTNLGASWIQLVCRSVCASNMFKISKWIPHKKKADQYFCLNYLPCGIMPLLKGLNENLEWRYLKKLYILKAIKNATDTDIIFSYT